jgi:hypothetical protein
MTPTHPPTKLCETQWRVHTELELNKHSRLNLANEKPLEKENRKIKTINEEESEEETNCWLATTTTTMEKQSGTTQQANKCFACRSTTMHMATKENKNEERRKTDDGFEEQQHNERTEGPNIHPTDGRRPLVAASVPPFPPWDPYLFCNSVS